MSIMNLNRGEIIFLKKTVVYSVITLVLTVVGLFLYYKYFGFSTAEAKIAYEKAEKSLNKSDLFLYYNTKCASAPNSYQCNGAYFNVLFELLESNNVLLAKNTFMEQNQADFDIIYASGQGRDCNNKVCTKSSYFVSMQIMKDGELIDEYTINRQYDIFYNKDGISMQDQIEKIEELGPLKLEQTHKFLEFLNNLAQDKQKALK